jgi:pimeloyl-ACP methyl ester carboxylesterase
MPFLDRLAERRTVIVPSLPGFPGALGHSVLDSHLDWLLAVRQLIAGADLADADLVGSSVGGSFAAEMAAVWPDSVRRLALIAPFGLFDATDPPTDLWAQRPDEIGGLLCADPASWDRLKDPPEGVNSVDWPVEQVRANEAAARAFWPLGNTRLEKRLSLIGAPTLLVWGEADRIMPRGYADRFAAGITGPTRIAVIPNAGHLAELDQPDAVAAAILDWMDAR